MKSLIGAIQVFLIFVTGLFIAPLATLFYIVFKRAHENPTRYPNWLITPDDAYAYALSAKHFGSYEATTVSVYRRFGRAIGDLYWLGWRNRLFGISYALKPDWLKRLFKYDLTKQMMLRDKYLGFIQVTRLVGNGLPYSEESLWEVEADLFFFGVIFGHRLSPIYEHPDWHPTRLINMDGRPVFSIRAPRSL